MKYISEYRDKNIVAGLVKKIREISKTPVTIMEVCGGHTMSIHKFGIPSLLPKTINLVSGPGCPVCVTDIRYIDKAIAFAQLPDVIITTYGDLIRVPGTHSSLEIEKGKGSDIRIVHSTIEALKIAKDNPEKKIIFLAIGFETTAPASAAAIANAKKEHINNFFLFSAHKVMPPAMAALIDEGIKINGYIAPGHVSTITGAKIYKDIPEKFNVAVVVSGFEPVDILSSIYMMVKQLENNDKKVEIEYSRVVTEEGNIKAQQLLEEIFELQDEGWRGLGILKNSGYRLKKKYSNFDALLHIPTKEVISIEPKGCQCGEILKGLIEPPACKLFGKTCTPENPVGACMVSNEGACAAYYKYNK